MPGRRPDADPFHASDVDMSRFSLWCNAFNRANGNENGCGCLTIRGETMVGRRPVSGGS